MSEEQYQGIVIFAPRPRDEVIGAFDALSKFNNEKSMTIVYGPNVTKDMQERFLKLKEYFTCNQMIQNMVPPLLLSKDTVLYFPDPSTEAAPERRKWGYEGEYLARRGYNVVFYSLNKNVPYIYEIEEKHTKLSILENVYPNSYMEEEIIYEGYTKWMF